MKIDFDWHKTIVFSVVFIGTVVLISLGKLPQEYLKYLFVWLVPSPINVTQKETDK